MTLRLTRFGARFRRKVLAQLLSNNSGGSLRQQLFDGAPFFAPLTNSLTLTRGTGTTTLTRSTTQTVENNDGKLVTALSGEAATKGARRIYNLCPTSSASIAVAANKTITATVGVYVVSMGAGMGTLTFTGTATGSTGTLAASASARTSAVLTITVGGTIIATASVATCVDIQFENVTAQTTQTAGEYVSVGVESAPLYHGSGVDGVKSYATDISGNPIPAATLDGIEIWPAATNLWTYSQEFDNAAWTKTAITIVANDAVAPDGTTTADKLTNDNNTTSTIDRTTTVTANTVYSDSVYIKYGNNAWARFLYGSGADVFQVWVNIQTGAVGTSSATGTGVVSGASVESVASGFWRVRIAGNLGGAITAWQRRIFLVNADNSGTIVAAAYAHHWGADLELGSHASPYIPTTTAAVTRNATGHSHPTSGNITAAAGTILLTYTPQHAPSGTVYLWGSYVDASNYTAILHDSTNLILRKRIAGVNTDATIANTFVSGTTYKMAATWGAGGQTIALNGTLGTPHANTTAAQIAATMQLGADGNSAGQPGFALEAEYIMQRQLSNSELQAVTAP